MKVLINVVMAALVAALVSPPANGATDSASLAAARELYGAAEYEEALTVLNQLQSGEGGSESPRGVAQYRAYCLLALGRAAEATEAIAVVVAADPFYQPSGADVSPRIRSAFSDVRRRLLPEIIQRQYADAKAMFEAKDFAAARDAFAQVLAALGDSDVTAAAAQPPLSDLRLLAAGFRDLSASGVAPPPIQARVQPVAMTAMTQPSRIYNLEDAAVVPPSTVRQVVPMFPLQGPAPRLGVLELVIDEHGGIESARMRSTVSPRYDAQLVAAAQDWTYTPATLDGVPVKYRKLVQISVQPK